MIIINLETKHYCKVDFRYGDNNIKLYYQHYEKLQEISHEALAATPLRFHEVGFDDRVSEYSIPSTQDIELFRR